MNMRSSEIIEMKRSGDIALSTKATDAEVIELWKKAINCVKEIHFILNHTRQLVRLKNHICQELAMSIGQVDQIFKGTRQPANSIEVLSECAIYLDNQAKNSNHKNWPVEGCKSQIFDSWYGGSHVAARQVQTQLNAMPVLNSELAGCLPNFDFWTPGVTSAEIAEHVSDFSTIAYLSNLATAGVCSIADGDFFKQLEIGKEAEAFGKSAGVDIAIFEGVYLQAESSRILADFESDRETRLALQKDAIRLYEQVIDFQPSHVRAIRGRARTFEVLGHLDEALSEFDRAIKMMTKKNELNSNTYRSNQHEQIRTLRHKLNCLAAIHADMPKWQLSAATRSRQIEDLLRESTVRHRSQLAGFASYENWHAIECFMADVLHAKALIEISREHEASERLKRALASRLRMLSPGAQFSNVQRGNILWWMAVAKRCTRVLSRSELDDLDMVEGLLIHGDNCEIVHPVLINFASTY